ncbi:MAG: ATP-dependent sacrificial sulfur transferase LarE, partial [Nitrososphaerales archaeon]
IEPFAKRRNINLWVDGTHSEDMRSPRPGVKALREAGFRAPFVELSYSKSDIRAIAKLANLSNAERPSEACLSSRIAYEQRIESNTLRMIEQSEEFIKQVTGANVVRVRTIGSGAVVELDRASIPTALEKVLEISDALKSLGYSSVEIDSEGYREGRMLSLFVQELQ